VLHYRTEGGSQTDKEVKKELEMDKRCGERVGHYEGALEILSVV
jgi:hypothetical protein